MNDAWTPYRTRPTAEPKPRTPEDEAYEAALDAVFAEQFRAPIVPEEEPAPEPKRSSWRDRVKS